MKANKMTEIILTASNVWVLNTKVKIFYRKGK